MLGVSVETLRRWETEGRLRMERSDGGQRLVDDRRGRPACSTSAGRPRPTGRSSPSRPATGSPASSRGSRRDRVAAVVEVIAGPHRMVSLMTAEAVEELGPQGRRRGGLRRQGDQRDRRDPVVEGVARDEVAPRRRPRRPARRRWPPARARRRRRRRAPRRPSRRPRPPRRRRRRRPQPVELTIYGAASLKGALEKAKAAYETANPGTTLTLSTDSSSALETQIEQGAPADVFLSADTTNPQEARRRGPRRRRRRRRSPATS